MSEELIRRCIECGEPQSLIRKSVPYPESGLDNVELGNAPVWVCANGHEELMIPAVEQLHNLLAHLVVLQPAPLSGRDIRFLRRRLGLTAREFSEKVDLTPERLSQFETNKAQPPRRTDLLVRLASAVLIAKKTGRQFPTEELARFVDELENSWHEAGVHRLRYNEQSSRRDQEWEATSR